MNFDTVSMKQRARTLIKMAKPSPLLSGLVIVIFNIVMMIILGKANNASASFYLIYMLVYTILSVMLTISLTWFSMKITREEQTVGSDILIGFKEKQGKVLIIAIVKGLCMYIGLAFFFVGALFPFYWFRFAGNIVKDDMTKNPIKALGKSMKLMKGHYIELIKIDLSFIGWWVLFLFTCGVAGIYILPYTSMVYAEFYDYIKGQYEDMNP